MNSPTDTQPHHADLPERVARLEVTCGHILEEMRGLRNDMQAMQNAIRSEMREARTELREFQNETRSEFKDVRRSATADFRILFGALIAVAIGLAGAMARGFGWI